MTNRPIAEPEHTLIEVQFATSMAGLPASEDFIRWALAAMNPEEDQRAMCIRIVDEREGRELNNNYRNKDYATNVLSFPADPPLLGDLVLCAPVIGQQAQAQHKALNAHYAHLTVHGVLHLRGYDHESDAEAQGMENEERRVLQRLGFSDPYAHGRLTADNCMQEVT